MYRLLFHDIDGNQYLSYKKYFDIEDAQQAVAECKDEKVTIGDSFLDHIDIIKED